MAFKVVAGCVGLDVCENLAVVASPLNARVELVDLQEKTTLAAYASPANGAEDPAAIRGPCRIRFLGGGAQFLVAEYGNQWVRLVDLSADLDAECKEDGRSMTLGTYKAPAGCGVFAVAVDSTETTVAVGCRGGVDPAARGMFLLYHRDPAAGLQAEPLRFEHDILDVAWVAAAHGGGYWLVLLREVGVVAAVSSFGVLRAFIRIPAARAPSCLAVSSATGQVVIGDMEASNVRTFDLRRNEGDGWSLVETCAEALPAPPNALSANGAYLLLTDGTVHQVSAAAAAVAAAAAEPPPPK